MRIHSVSDLQCTNLPVKKAQEPQKRRLNLFQPDEVLSGTRPLLHVLGSARRVLQCSAGATRRRWTQIETLHLRETEYFTEATVDLNIGRAMSRNGISHEYIVNLLDEDNMTALKSSTKLRWERRDNDEEELPWSDQRVHPQLVGKRLCIGRADLVKPWPIK